VYGIHSPGYGRKRAMGHGSRRAVFIDRLKVVIKPQAKQEPVRVFAIVAKGFFREVFRKTVSAKVRHRLDEKSILLGEVCHAFTQLFAPVSSHQAAIDAE